MLANALIDALRPYHFRGKMRVLSPLVPPAGERRARVFGYDVELDLGEAIQRWIYLGAFEPKETELARAWLQPGMTFVDVGANFGYFTLLASSRVGASGRVFALEPSPYAHGRLAETLASNGLDQVVLVQAGLSASPGTLDLYIPPNGFHSPTMSANSGGEPVQVPVLTLDRCLSDWGVDEVDLIKIDVEGHELRVLDGAAEALANGRIRAILIEFNDYWLRRQGTTPQEVYGRLVAAGFEDTEGVPHFEESGVDTRFLVHRGSGAERTDRKGPR
jgi:FkbM family methyltransferase